MAPLECAAAAICDSAGVRSGWPRKLPVSGLV